MNLYWQSFCVIAFGSTCWAVGDFLCERFFRGNIKLSSIARHTLSFAAGNVFISYLLTALGFIGAFVPAVLWALFFTGIGITIWRIAQDFRRSHISGSVSQTIQEEAISRIPEDKRKEGCAPIFLMAILGLFILPAILQAAAPPYVRDSLVYHLLCPKEYLKAGCLLHIDGNLFSAFPKGHEVLMTLLLAISGDRAAQGFSILQQIAAIGSVYSLTRLMNGTWPAILCTLGYATVPIAIYFSGCAYVEPALLMTFGSTLLALFLFFKSSAATILSEKMNLKTIAFIGFLAGWMPALKYNGLIYTGLVGLIFLWSYRKVPIKKVLTISAAFIMALIPGLCWMVWNWIDLGNPVYPMAWFLFGGKGWDEAQALAMSLYFDAYGMGRNLLDYLILPWRLAFSGGFDTIRFDGAIGPFLLIFLILAVASVIGLVRRRSAAVMGKEIGLMFVVSGAFFMFGTQQTRFWLPSQMLVCAFAAPALERLVSWAKNRLLIKEVLFLILVGSLVWNMWFLGKQFLAVGYYKPVLGMESERDFLRRKVPGYPALEFINKDLPKSSRLMCVWTGAYGYYIDRQYYSDTLIEDITIKKLINVSANGKELSQRLVQAGYTHIFMRVSLLAKNTTSKQKEVFRGFLEFGAIELFRYQDFLVLKIHGV
jgi:hypothetical protein